MPECREARVPVGLVVSERERTIIAVLPSVGNVVFYDGDDTERLNPLTDVPEWVRKAIAEHAPDWATE